MKTTSVIEKEIVFHGNEYSDSPSKVRLEFTGEDAHRIASCMSLLKDNKDFGIISMRIRPPEYTLLGSDDKEETNWRDEGGQLIVFQESIYFYSQSKWDSSDQIESGGMDFDEIMAGFAIINAKAE